MYKKVGCTCSDYLKKKTKRSDNVFYIDESTRKWHHKAAKVAHDIEYVNMSCEFRLRQRVDKIHIDQLKRVRRQNEM